MAFYRVCSDCGANLDPGEHCECFRERKEKEKKLAVLFRQGPDGQMEIGGLYVSNRKRSNYLH